MRYASVCDGIGAAHVAWQPLGWRCQWTSEIEPFPAAVVEHHYGFRNLGDMTAITEEMLDAPVDLLVGGTPCQSFSVAGLRGGLADPRGNLALRFIQLAAVMQPRWIVWENVPGVLSSGGGRDFGTFLGALGELGYGFAYRVLDAQWFGVAQRRRRVFVVAHARDWRRAAAVLFERESLLGNPPTRGAKGQVSASGFADCSGGGLAKPLGSHALSKGRGTDLDNTTYVAEPHAIYSNESRCDNIPPAGLSPPLKIGSDGGGNPPCIAFPLDTQNCTEGHASGGRGYGENGDPSFTLSKGHSHAVAFTKSKRAQSTTDEKTWVPGEVSPTMSCFDQGDTRATTVVAFKPKYITRDNPKMEGAPRVDGTTFTCLTNDTGDNAQCVATAMAVRRLTPRECERLQGFPDQWTAITYRNKPAADGPRYRALGNSMAVPVMRWIGERIAKVDSLARGAVA